MKIQFFKSHLNDNSRRIITLVQDVSDDQARWKPDPRSWSILEVINHLYDEEREDFRVRLEILLYYPEKPWPLINPEGWVNQRKYNQRDLQDSLDSFLAERRASLKWLDTLDEPDFGTVFSSPFGSLSAGDMLTSWAAHDLLHMRQLIELHRAYMELQAESFRMDYAGQW
jgi:uncharacterized damage-inducible protein DinB